uniref:Uncharacterized protein n=1 Tax=Sphaerodactylus townsendi TaxID=933632 RepID=A0ACB8FRS9_9SAUR
MCGSLSELLMATDSSSNRAFFAIEKSHLADGFLSEEETGTPISSMEEWCGHNPRVGCLDLVCHIGRSCRTQVEQSHIALWDTSTTEQGTFCTRSLNAVKKMLLVELVTIPTLALMEECGPFTHLSTQQLCNPSTDLNVLSRHFP